MKEKKSKKSAQKASAAGAETRQAMMLKAKEIGIKNFRVLNKMELAKVLAEAVRKKRSTRL